MGHWSPPMMPFLPKHRENPDLCGDLSMFGISARCRMLFSRQDILNVIICYICWIMYIVHGIYICIYANHTSWISYIYTQIRYEHLKKTTNTLLQCVKQKHIHFAALEVAAFSLWEIRSGDATLAELRRNMRHLVSRVMWCRKMWNDPKQKADNKDTLW